MQIIIKLNDEFPIFFWRKGYKWEINDMDRSKGRKTLSLKGKSEGEAEQHMLHTIGST